jgi:hypothetical protein
MTMGELMHGIEWETASDVDGTMQIVEAVQ